MFDLHYDLLTYVYMNRYNLDKVRKHLNKLFSNENITGGIFNLFYMSPKEMKDELDIDYEDINIVKNLKTVDLLIKKERLIPKNIKYTYGIEGLDYLKDIDDMDILYNLGVRSVNIVWNNDNKFGGGAKGDKNRGLTLLGEKLVEKLVDLGIAIDLSHANEKTFYDVIEICNRLKLRKVRGIPKVFVSHSNVRILCNNVRNLSDEQLLEIKKFNGIVGIVEVKPFCIKEDSFNNNKDKYEKAYLEHIKYLKELFGDCKNISVSSDDMTYYETKYYNHFNCFKQYEMRKRIENLLQNDGFNEIEINNILYNNANRFFLYN